MAWDMYVYGIAQKAFKLVGAFHLLAGAHMLDFSFNFFFLLITSAHINYSTMHKRHTFSFDGKLEIVHSTVFGAVKVF